MGSSALLRPLRQRDCYAQAPRDHVQKIAEIAGPALLNPIRSGLDEQMFGAD